MANKEMSFETAFITYGTLLSIVMLLIFKMLPDMYDYVNGMNSKISFDCYVNCTIPHCEIKGNYPPEACAEIINAINKD